MYNLALTKSNKIVPYLTVEEVRAMYNNTIRQRDRLLLKLLFETGLRISEALSLTPAKISSLNGHFVLNIVGKGNKPRMVACPDNLVNELKGYAFDKKLGLNDRFFPINRQRAWQIVKEVAKKTGINKRVFPHLFRHSDAIFRLRQTGNPKALQYHLGHSSPVMVLRYLTTLTAEDAVKIEQEVQFE